MPSPIDALVDTCVSIGNDVSDANGFVSIERLLARFRSQISVRPLLVEAMLTSTGTNGADSGPQSGWTILVDSETYPVNAADIQRESATYPLPDRFRNTVAHELTHSLAFRRTEFSSAMRATFDELTNPQIERLTERLSPLLLIPERALTAQVREMTAPMSIGELVQWRRMWRISRYVLLSRLAQLPRDHPSRQSPGLRNCAAGIATLNAKREIVLAGWPVYAEFDRNIQPRFLTTLVAREQLAISEVVRNDVLPDCADLARYATWEASAGVLGSETNYPMTVTLSVEAVKGSSSGTFFWVLRPSPPKKTST